jgi:hypothetical protein
MYVGVHLSRDQPSTPSLIAFPTHLFAMYDSDGNSEQDLNGTTETFEKLAPLMTDEPPAKRKKKPHSKISKMISSVMKQSAKRLNI